MGTAGYRLFEETDILYVHLLYFPVVKIFEIIHFCAHLYHHGVQKGKRCHTFHDNHGSRNNYRVVSALDGNVDFLTLFVYGLLGAEDRRGGLYMRPQDNGVTVADAAQNTAGVVGCFYGFAVLRAESVIVFAAVTP